MRSSFSKIVGILVLLGTLVSGCVATVRTRPAYAVYEDYPHTYYDGRAVYYIDGYWQYRSGDRWVIAYRDEPHRLYEYRARRSAPSAHTYDRRYRHEHVERRRRVERREPEPARRSAPSADSYR